MARSMPGSRPALSGPAHRRPVLVEHQRGRQSASVRAASAREALTKD
jgi:hypothetical protein